MNVESPPHPVLTDAGAGSRGGRRRLDRAAGAFLVIVMALGCAVMWIGLPIASLWGVAQITESSATHFLLALPVTILSIILFARALFWVNRLYLRVGLASRARTDDDWDEDEEYDEPRWARGPLEPMLVGSLVVALIALTVWFLVFAENPSRYGFVP